MPVVFTVAALAAPGERRRTVRRTAGTRMPADD
jgi:hypothetical protein